jgi:hypothetical protein
LRHHKSSTWREHYATTVGSLNSCDERLSKALGHAELAIFTRLQEIERSPDHALELQELTKAVEGLLLIKTAVLGYPEFEQPLKPPSSSLIRFTGRSSPVSFPSRF